MEGNHHPREIFEAGEDKGKDDRANHISIATGIVSLFTAAALVYFAVKTDAYSDRSSTAAEESATVANDMAEFEESEQTHQYASKVYLGEAPQYYRAAVDATQRCPSPENVCRNRVVINASGAQINNVWLEYENDRRIKIDAVQRCTLYDLPVYATSADRNPQGEPTSQVEPESLYFTDAYGAWQRTKDGSVKEVDREFVTEGIEALEFGNSNAMDISDCDG